MSRPADPLTGVKSFTIGGRMTDIRQRCMGMTDEERRWRAQFLKDQILSPDEPRIVPEYYKETTNFFRRLWRTPAWKFQLLLEPLMGKSKAYLVRNYITKTLSMVAIGMIGTYYVKYYSNDWTHNKGIETFVSRGRMYPDDPGYPNYYKKTPQDYYDNGFYSSAFAVKPKKSTEVESGGAPVREDGTEIVCQPSSQS